MTDEEILADRKARLADARAVLAEYESGRLTSRTGPPGNMIDDTEEQKASLRLVIADYESQIVQLEKTSP